MNIYSVLNDLKMSCSFEDMYAILDIETVVIYTHKVKHTCLLYFHCQSVAVQFVACQCLSC
jgi:hypothetical protein